MAILETRYGSLEVLDIEHDLIGRFLARYGEWAYSEVCFVAAAMPKDRPLHVLDIGAFIGTFGIGLSQIANVASTTFVEANPSLIPLLSRNAARNARGRFEVIEAAITPNAEVLSGTYDTQNLGSLSFSGSDTPARTQASTPARFMKLSDLIIQADRVDLIKMDVEGLEHSILAADKSLLAPDGPSFWLECNDSPNSLELLDLLIENDLNVHYFAFPSFVANNFLGNPEPIFPWAYEAGLWASRDLAPILPPALLAHECILKSARTRDELRHAMWQTPRWAPADWQNASRAELVAEAAHAILGERLAQFLVDPKAVSNIGENNELQGKRKIFNIFSKCF
jgi:FkbM family methyltransferase